MIQKRPRNAIAISSQAALLKPMVHCQDAIRKKRHVAGAPMDTGRYILTSVPIRCRDLQGPRIRTLFHIPALEPVGPPAVPGG